MTQRLSTVPLQRAGDPRVFLVLFWGGGGAAPRIAPQTRRDGGPSGQKSGAGGEHGKRFTIRRPSPSSIVCRPDSTTKQNAGSSRAGPARPFTADRRVRIRLFDDKGRAASRYRLHTAYRLDGADPVDSAGSPSCSNGGPGARLRFPAIRRGRTLAAWAIRRRRGGCCLPRFRLI